MFKHTSIKAATRNLISNFGTSMYIFKTIIA